MTTRRTFLGGASAVAATGVGHHALAQAVAASGAVTQSGLVGKLEGAVQSASIPASFKEAPELAALLFLRHAAVRLFPVLRHVVPGLDRAPAWWGRRVGAVSRGIDRSSWQGGVLLGVTLGFLPCGLLYAALAAAASSGGAGPGALAMVAFGLGTVPSLVAIGVAGGAAAGRWQRAMGTVAPVLMLANAVLLAAMAWRLMAGA